jgi:hypothetical protein
MSWTVFPYNFIEYVFLIDTKIDFTRPLESHCRKQLIFSENGVAFSSNIRLSAVQAPLS